MHKAPAFRAVGPRDGRPVMLDDTCYFLPCSTAPEAAALAALCNDPIALELVRSASFPDAKRPITKALLQRIDLRAVLGRADFRRLRDRAAASMAGELGTDPTPERLERVDEVFSSLERPPAVEEPGPLGQNPPVLMTGSENVMAFARRDECTAVSGRRLDRAA